MGVQNIFLGLLNWFLPDSIKEDNSARIRGQFIVAIVIYFTLIQPTIVGRIANIGTSYAFSLAYLKTALLVIMFGSLFVLKYKGTLILVGNVIMTGFWLHQLVNLSITGGLESVALGGLVMPVIFSVFLLGRRYGIFYAVLTLATLFVLYYLHENSELEFYIREVTIGNKLVTVFSLLIAMGTGLIIIQSIKNNAIKTFVEERGKNVGLANSLQEIIDEIGINSSTLASASEELSQMSQEMLKNSDEISTSQTETAASVTQSSNTIQELSMSLQETARRMKKLESMAANAEDEGKTGTEIIEESDAIMKQIEKNSRMIGNSVQVISDIAEQTNLLSLNAAIEADKAGDYGRGFAIVAEEVGSLAARSNEAAIRIRELIENSNVSVEDGKRIIEESDQVLGDIIRDIGGIASRTHDAAISINEQNIGTREIAKGAEDISQVSDRNANLVENLTQSISDTTNAIGVLSRIADQLDSQISQHKT